MSNYCWAEMFYLLFKNIQDAHLLKWTIVFSQWKRSVLLRTGLQRVFVLSVSGDCDNPTTEKLALQPAAAAKSFISFSIWALLLSRATLGWKSFYPQSFPTASSVVLSPAGQVQDSEPGGVIGAIRARIWRSPCMEIDVCLRWGGGGVAPAASCLCDLTVCVNQEPVAARPASLISISLQITPHRQRDGAEL